MTDVNVRLTQDQAVVLLEWLAKQASGIAEAEEAERRVVWVLEGCIEKGLNCILSEDYTSIVDAARRRSIEGGIRVDRST
jgi:hypothetical protein